MSILLQFHFEWGNTSYVLKKLMHALKKKSLSRCQAVKLPTVLFLAVRRNVEIHDLMSGVVVLFGSVRFGPTFFEGKLCRFFA